MNYLDILMLVIIAMSVTTAMVKGLLTELISFTGVLVGLLTAMFLCLELARLLAELSFHPLVSGFLGFVTVFVFFLVAGIVIGVLAIKFFRFRPLKRRDRLICGILGAGRGIMINMAIIIAFTAFPISLNLLAESVLSPVFASGARLFVFVAPGEFQDFFYQGYDQLLSISGNGDSQGVLDSAETE